MFLRPPLIIPTVGQIGSEIITPNQARAPHPQPLENGLRQIADVEYYLSPFFRSHSS
jgi:hypothetical protein